MANVVVEAKGAPFAVQPSLYGAPSYTNSLTFSNDLTNAAWTQTGTDVAALDAAGLTGAPNTATTLTDDDGASSEVTQKSVSIPADTNTNTVRFFIKKDTDETRFPAFRLNYAGTTKQIIYLNTKTGDMVQATGSEDYEVNDRGDWWELLMQSVNSSFSTAVVYVYPANATVIGVGNAAATGSIIVGNVELHLNKTIAAVRGSSPILTAASTVTTTAISMSYDIANHSDEKGAYYCEYSGIGGSSNPRAIGFTGSPTSIFSLNSTGGIAVSSWDGTSEVARPTADSSSNTVSVGLAYSANDSLKTIYGTTSLEGAYDGNYSGSATSLNLFSGNYPSQAANLIRNIRRYNLNYTAAKAKITELMS